METASDYNRTFGSACIPRETRKDSAMKRLVPILLLAGCVQADPIPAPPPLPAAAQDTCNANSYAELVGQDASALERVLILGRVRIIRPGQPVTMDYWANRINFMIDADERIAKISCG